MAIDVKATPTILRSIIVLLLVFARQFPGTLSKNFHTLYFLVTSYPEVDFVLLSVAATPVETPQVQFLDQLFMLVEVPTPVKFATGAVLGQSLHACCYWSGAESQTVQKTVEIRQAPFLDKVNMPVVIGLVPEARQRRKL